MVKEAGINDNKFGFAAFILGLCSILFFWALFIPSMIMGVVGIIFAIIQLRKGRSKFAIAGLILSAIGFIIALIIVMKLGAMIALLSDCQKNPNSSACIELAGRLNVDTQTMTCITNPQAPGCEDILSAYATQNTSPASTGY